MIVTQANADMAAVHDAMPAILEKDTIAAWLDGTAGAELLGPAPEDTLMHWPVSRRVNRVENDDEKLIEPPAA
jgi:putative SOS response-associated peptidase YedK